MYKAMVRRMIRRSVRALRDGDLGPLLAGFADDAVLVFPGESSWAGEHRGKSAIESFLRRFLEAGLVGDVHDIVVNGPPWRTTVCVLFHRPSHESGRGGRLREPGHVPGARCVGQGRVPGGFPRH